mgnify:CR=1 FL=1
MSRKTVIRRPYLRWGMLALVQLGLIAVPLADRLEVQLRGQEVVLDLRPVDPRDLLRGDYVIINLALTQISTDVPGAKDSWKAGDTVFVGLDTSGATAVPANVTGTRADAGPLAISGVVVSAADDTVLRVDYGIDAFFLPEGEGKKVERLAADRVHLVAAIGPKGRSVPLRLLVDGEEFKSDAAF